MDYERIEEQIIWDRIKQMYNDMDDAAKSQVERVFPELKESEDERIRKWLIALIKSNEYGHISNVGEMPCSKLNVLAWLEKQGEQPKKHDVCDNCDQQGGCVSPCPMKLVEKHGEQKQELLTKEKALENSPFVEQKSAEWTAEDKSILFCTISDLKFLRDIISKDPKYAVNIIDIEREINWLKSLKDRYTWKPSEEQIEVLNWCKPLWTEPKTKAVLETLIEDLKKLKG